MKLWEILLVIGLSGIAIIISLRLKNLYTKYRAIKKIKKDFLNNARYLEDEETFIFRVDDDYGLSDFEIKKILDKCSEKYSEELEKHINQEVEYDTVIRTYTYEGDDLKDED
jgi:hypothetical protein